MDKETLSNYGWIVILVLVLSVLLAFATPFGNFVATAVKSTTAGFFSVNESALGAAGITIPGQDFENTNAGYDHNAPELNPSDTIPTGGYYGNMNPSTMEVVWYDEMPATVSENDVYLYGDYFYGFVDPYEGWEVALAVDELAGIFPAGYETTNRNQTSYDPILESINGKPITGLYYTFNECVNLTKVPAIPSGVTSLEWAFANCDSLENINDIIIPDGVTNMYCTFSGTAVVDASKLVIPSSVRNMDTTFANCHSLVKAPVIPYGVESMSGTFSDCTSLVNPPEIPSSATFLWSTFLDSPNVTGIIKVSCAAETVLMVKGTQATIEVYHIDGCGHN